ncbi:hypothetical protein GCK32_006550 [Trichostrongylus colubriformis]|uniref:Peptidase S1 domain-containing protein n=1 Tax=Trichostrongylus colubriformis TaxID=6319 RepID=A0AAN8FJZ9_TRICO
MNLLLLLIFAAMVSCTRRITKEENDIIQVNCGLPKLRKNHHPLEARHKLIDKYPWSVFIQVNSSGTNSSCDGNLISFRHLLTTARKPVLKDIEIFSLYVGSKCRGSGSCAKRHSVTKVWVNEKYLYCSDFHDTAILEFEDDVSIKEASPICLPEKNLKLDKKMKTIVLKSNGSVNDPESRSMKVQKFSEHNEERKLHQIITNRTEEEKSECMEGGGGPLFQLTQWRRNTLVGVRSPSDCKSNSKGGNNTRFADIRYQIDWICATIGVCPANLKTESCDESKGEICGHTFLVLLLNGTDTN